MAKRKKLRRAITKTGPTGRAYPALEAAYTYFNNTLFGNRLPGCLITMQRKAGSRAYFAFERFGSANGEIVDEIAINPKHFEGRSVAEILSSIVHEQVHQQQYCFGKPSRRGYHNKEWALMMDAVGLTPSTTGKPGGKRTGGRVTHYIVKNGPFARAFKTFKFDENALYRDLWGDKERKERRDKTKYTCPGCELNVWGKPAVRVACIECDRELTAEED